MPELLSQRQEDVLILTFNRPEKRNALSTEMLQLFEEAIARAEEDSQLRAVILTGAGDKSFSAGFDLGLLVWRSPSDVTCG